jgi:exodeoxyribonuclease-3
MVASKMGTWRYTMADNICLYDENAQGLYGLTEAGFLHDERGVKEKFHPDDLDRMWARVAKAIDPQGEGLYEVEYRVKQLDGSWRWLSAWGYVEFEGEDESRRAVAITGASRDISDRVEADEGQRILINELNHRVKNMLATVQSIAMHTQRSTPDAFAENFEARLMALSRAHELLTRSQWAGVGLREVIEQALAPYVESENPPFRLVGPDVTLNARAGLALGLVLHELATNAAKYGALSTGAGNVSCSWSVQSDGGARAMTLNWCETGGPGVSEPKRKGFGSRLIKRTIEMDLGGEAVMDFRSPGLQCRFAFSLDAAEADVVLRPSCSRRRRRRLYRHDDRGDVGRHGLRNRGLGCQRGSRAALCGGERNRFCPSRHEPAGKERRAGCRCARRKSRPLPVRERLWLGWSSGSSAAQSGDPEAFHAKRTGSRSARRTRIAWPPMKIATYNVNGVNGRLPVLLRWLKETAPDIVCLQELKAPQERFPERDIARAGYGSIWQGQKSWNGVAILSKGEAPVERRRTLPGDPEDSHSRYIEAQIGELTVGCLYLPNGNPWPGAKFDFKLRWFARLQRHAKSLLKNGKPVILAGDYNVMPTEIDVYNPERWRDDALFRIEVRDAYAKLVKQGWHDALRETHPGERIYTFWKYFRNAFARDAGLRIDHLLLSPDLRNRLVASGVDRKVRSWEKTSDHAPVWIELSASKARVRKSPGGRR